MTSVSPLKDENGNKVLTAKTASGKKKGDDQQELLRCKRRINFQSLGYNIPQPAPQSVARRNERERNRVKLVNTGFAQLREHVPNGSKNKKMSKVETLKSAIEYIRELQRLLEENEAAAAYATVTLRTHPAHYSPDSYITSSPHGYPSPQSYHQPSPTSFYDPTSPQYTVAPSTHFYKQFKFDSHQQNENVNYQPGQIGRPSYQGGTMSTGSPSPSYMSDTSTGDGPTSPKEEDVMEFASWFTA